MANYFYARVSTAEQNEARQLDAAQKAEIELNRVYIDKESGKDFNRESWRKLTRKLKKGDVLYVKSLDRIGRNYKETIEQWQYLTKKKEVDIVVLDMPLLDTRREKGLLGTFIADVVLQILSFVAENERANIRQRAREGIEAAKARGVRFGRPEVILPDGFNKWANKYLNGECTQEYGAQQCGMAVTTFRHKALQLGKKNKRHRKPYKRLAGQRTVPFKVKDEETFDNVARQWLCGDFTADDAAKKLGISKSCFSRYVKKRFPDEKWRHKPILQTRYINDENFLKAANEWLEGKVTSKMAAIKLGMSNQYFIWLVKRIYPGETPPHKGVKYKPTPDNFKTIVKGWINDDLTTKRAAELCGFSTGTFRKRALPYL